MTMRAMETALLDLAHELRDLPEAFIVGGGVEHHGTGAVAEARIIVHDLFGAHDAIGIDRLQRGARDAGLDPHRLAVSTFVATLGELLAD